MYDRITAPRQGPRRWLLGATVIAVVVTVALLASPAAAVQESENVSVYRSPNGSYGSAAAVEAAIANGSLQSAGGVARNDTLVVAIRSDRLADEMNASDGSATERFFAALDGETDFRIVQTNPGTMVNRKVAITGPDNVTVHPAGTTAYLLVDTGALTFEYRSVNRTTQVYEGDRFAVQFGENLSGTLSRGSEPKSPIIEFKPRSALSTATPTETAVTATATATASPTATIAPAAETATMASPDGRTTAATATDTAGTTTGEGAGFETLVALCSLLVGGLLAAERGRR